MNYIILILLFVVPLYSQNERITVQVQGDSVIVNNTGLVENCAFRCRINVYVKGDSIAFVEKDTSKNWMTCICGFSVSGVIKGLIPGTYRLFVFRGYSVPWVPDTLYFKGMVIFTIGGSGSGIVQSKGNQSNCIPEDVESDFTVIPDGYELTAYPNPFNATTVISFSMPQSGFVRLRIFNTSGREVETLFGGILQVGVHSIAWNASRFESGVYLCRFEMSGITKTVKLTLIR